MDISFYQGQTSSTAVFPGAGRVIRAGQPVDGETFTALSYVLFGLMGETGEIAEKVKKVIRDKNATFTEDDLREIGKEAGDVVWYLAQFCRIVGVDLGQVLSGNLEKLASRKERGVLGGSGDNR